MTLPSIPFLRPARRPEQSPTLKVVPRGDVQWDRAIFKAPPLRVDPPAAQAIDFGETLSRATIRS